MSLKFQIFAKISFILSLTNLVVGNDLMNKVQSHLEMCKFMEQNIYDGPDLPESVPNIATINIGTAIRHARSRLWDRDVDEEEAAGAQCCGGPLLQKMLNRRRYEEAKVLRLGRRLAQCVNELARRSSITGGGGGIPIIINPNSGQLQNLLWNGRELIDQITYYPDYDLTSKFFIDLIKAFLTPFATKDSLVEDIMIGTRKMGYWDKKIFEKLTNEEFLSELKYNSDGPTPYWQAKFNFPDGKYAIVQFCQWSKYLGYGQKFRMRYNLKNEQGLNALMQKFEGILNPKDVEICF